MDRNYLDKRQKKGYTSYRMQKRTSVIIDSLKELTNDNFCSILDVGTADGEMLKNINTILKPKLSVGMDIYKDAIESASQIKSIEVLLGNYVNLPFKESRFDLLLASAVVEHIKDVDSVLKESYRVLKKGGLLCITLPNPFFDWINSKIVTTYHVKRFWLKDIIHLMQNQGFTIIQARYFMICPFGKLPFEEPLEKILRFFGLDCLFFNHITVGKKT